MKYGKWLALAAAIIFIAAPLIARGGSPPLQGSESYHNLMLAEQFSENPSIIFEEFKDYYILPYSLSLLSLAFPVQNLVYISALLTLLSAFFIYKAMKNLDFSEDISVLTTIVYIFSPLYVYTATSLTQNSASIFLITLSLFIYSKRKSWISLLPAVPVAILSPEMFLACSLAFTTLLYYGKKDWKSPVIMTGFGGALIAFFNYVLGFRSSFNITGGLDLGIYITDLGAVVGYTFFSFALTIIAIFVLWNKKSMLVPCIVFTGIFILSAYSPDVRLIVNLFLSGFTAYSLNYLWKREWALEDLRDLTLMILALSLLFSAVSFTNRIQSMDPTKETIKTLEAIKDLERPGKVLSSRENGFILEYYTNKEAYWTELDPAKGRKHTVYSDITDSTSPNLIMTIMDEEEITYIYMDKNMKKQSGINTALDVGENFIKLAGVGEKSSWLYIRI